MSPREHGCLSTVPYTEVPVYTKPVLRSSGSVGEIDELAVVYDSAEEIVGPAEEAFGHTKDAASCYLGLATDYLASFKAAQLGLKAADGVLDTLDRATRCEEDDSEVDCVESLPVQKFDDINFDAESDSDSDYCPSEDSEEDDLEYDSEAEVSDGEADMVCVKAKANSYVRILQRQCRAVRRAGTKQAGTARPVQTIGEVSLVGAICETFNLNFFLSVVGLKLEPVNKIIAKQDYDSEEDADYCPSESDEGSELEYDSKAEISEESDEEEQTDEVSMMFFELDFKNDVSEDDEDYCPSESDLEYDMETYTMPVLRSSAFAAELNYGLDMKEYEEDTDYDYDSYESVSEESDDEVTEEVSTQMFGEIDFKDYDSGEDADYWPSEAEAAMILEDYREAETFTKPILRNSAKVTELNHGLNFKDYLVDVDYCNSESEEDSEYDTDSEISEESDEE